MDVLHVRTRTTGQHALALDPLAWARFYCLLPGIVERHFQIEKSKFSIIDVGGQRNERKKWIYSFEHVTTVVYVVDCSAFDMVRVCIDMSINTCNAR